MFIIRQKTLGEKLGIKASVLNADGREDGLEMEGTDGDVDEPNACLLYTSPSPRDGLLSRMPSSA